MVDLPVAVGALTPPVKGELGRELNAPWTAGKGLDALPKVILHSFSGRRSMLGTSTRSKGKVGTSWMTLDVNATPHSPGILAPSVIMVDIKVLMDLWNSSSTSAISDDPLPEPSFPMR